jgi:hypothetical protein
VVDRALDAGDDRAHRGVVVLEQRHDLLGLGALGKPGKAAQVAEHDNDLAAMAFEDPVVALRDDEVGELRREKAAQFAGPLDLGELGGDTRLQFAVPPGDLVGAGAQFAEQPRVLHRDDRLRREVLQQCDLLVGERAHLLAVDDDRPKQSIFFFRSATASHVRMPPASIRSWSSGSAR